MASKNTAKRADWFDSFDSFVQEFKNESDRAAVILGAAKLDAILYQILDRVLLPSIGSADELLDGDSPLATFSARINTIYRLGLINADFAKSLHLVRRIRNAFAHEVVGVSLSSGSHADRLKSLLLPFQTQSMFGHFREAFIGEQSLPNDFRACLALIAGRLEGILSAAKPFVQQPNGELILAHWENYEPSKVGKGES